MGYSEHIRTILNWTNAENQQDIAFVLSADGLIVSHLPYGPTAYFTLTNVVMRHDIPSVGTMSEVFPHLIFDNFTTKLGKRVNTFVIFLSLCISLF